MQALRITLFYLLLSLSACIWCLICLVVAPLLSYRARCRLVIQAWCSSAVWLTRVMLNIRYEVKGLENIPQQPCVILSNHQSTWETFYLSAQFGPLIQVLKRELLRVPFFGWAMALAKPIAIDRSNPKAALKQVAAQGEDRLKRGTWVLIFPEGTRVPPGQIGKFSRSGAALAASTGLPVLPVAHNAGEFWPKEGWGKRAGTIQVVIGAPMYVAGEGPRAVAELNERAYQWVVEQQTAMRGSAPQPVTASE